MGLEIHMLTYRSCYNPILPCNKLCSSDRKITYFKCFHQCLCFMIPNAHATIVKTGQHPWLCRMQIHTLNSIGSSSKFSLFQVLMVHMGEEIQERHWAEESWDHLHRPAIRDNAETKTALRMLTFERWTEEENPAKETKKERESSVKGN